MKMSDHIYDDYYNRLELAHDFTIELRREFSDLLAKYEALVKVCDKLDTEEQRTAVTQIMREEFLTGLMQRTVESANADKGSLSIIERLRSYCDNLENCQSENE